MGLKHRHISRDPLTTLLYQGLLCGLYPRIPLFPIPPAARTGPRVQFSPDLGIPGGQGGTAVHPKQTPSAACTLSRGPGGSFTRSFARQPPPLPQCPWKTPACPMDGTHAPDDRGGDLCTEEHAEAPHCVGGEHAHDGEGDGELVLDAVAHSWGRAGAVRGWRVRGRGQGGGVLTALSPPPLCLG